MSADEGAQGEGVNIDVDIRTLSIDQLDKLAARAVRARQLAKTARQAAQEVTAATAYLGSAETALGFQPAAIPGQPSGPVHPSSAQMRRAAGRYGAAASARFPAYSAQAPLPAGGAPDLRAPARAAPPAPAVAAPPPAPNDAAPPGGPPVPPPPPAAQYVPGYSEAEPPTGGAAPEIPYASADDIRTRRRQARELAAAERAAARAEERERAKHARREERLRAQQARHDRMQAERAERARSRALFAAERQHAVRPGSRAAEASRLARYEASSFAAAARISPSAGLAAGVAPVPSPPGIPPELEIGGGRDLALTAEGVPLGRPERAGERLGAMYRELGAEAELAAEAGLSPRSVLNELKEFLNNPPAAVLKWMTAAPFAGKMAVAIFATAAAYHVIERRIEAYFAPGQPGDIRKKIRDAARHIEGLAPLVDYRAGRVFFTADTKVEQAVPELTYTDGLRDGELRYRQLHQGSLV